MFYEAAFQVHKLSFRYLDLENLKVEDKVETLQ